jgi:hypothetical protein
MVTIIDFKQSVNSDTLEEFISLVVQGDIQLVQSKETGRFYATAFKCSIPSTFSEEVAASLIGSQISGSIVKVPCDPYEYTIEESGEVITLDFKYEYAPDKTDDRSTKTETRDVEVKPDLKTFSTNGSRELVEA